MSDLKEQFNFNLMLAKALAQLMPEIERQQISLWFDVLSEMDETDADLIIRNEYMYFILLMLQNNKIEDYFKRLPPYQILPLKKVIPRAIIDDVLIAVDQNMTWLDNVTDEEKEKQLKEKKVAPDKFLDSQPIPKEGCPLLTQNRSTASEKLQ